MNQARTSTTFSNFFHTRPRLAARGFTLVELLVTVAIITVLIALLLSGLKGMRSAAWSAKCSSNLHQVATACAAYATERRLLPHPGTQPLMTLLEMPAEVWVCPANHGLEGVAVQSYTYPASPIWARGLRPGDRIDWWALVTRTYEQNTRTPLVQDLFKWHGYRNVAGYDTAVTRDYEGGLEAIANLP